MLFSYFFLPDFSSRVHVNQPSKRLIVFMTFVTHKNHTVIIIPLKKKKKRADKLRGKTLESVSRCPLLASCPAAALLLRT